jgi:outer membrane protein TolC/ABC-type uncharacterized transport system substrate-binding protein
MTKTAKTHRLCTSWLIFVTILLVPAVAGAAAKIDIAVVTDGPQHQLVEVEQVFREELLALTEGEFEVRFKPLAAEWSAASVDAAMASAYRDPAIDMVLVLGFAANQLVVSQESFPKPTFLPLVFNPDLLSAPSQADRSGRENLNYLSDRVPFSENLASFQRVLPFASAVILTDAVILESIPRGPAVVRRQGANVAFSFVGHDGVDHDLLAKIPAGTQAVVLGGLPRLPAALFDDLLAGFAQRNIACFSLISEAEVRRGALGSDTVQTDYRRLARRNALNMQAVMLGERAEDQPIYYDSKRQLTINMDTARAIGLSPSFDVLSEAELINAEAVSTGPQLDLVSVATLALADNLDLAGSRLDVRIGEQGVRAARSNLLPQLSVGGSYTARRDQSLTRSALSPERATAAALTLNQLVYSEAATAGYQQEKLLQQGRLAGLDAARLDRVLEATTAYLQALRADTQLSIQQDNLALTKTNLELARDRVRVGSASNADVYRWEANLAGARSAVLAALAAKQQAHESLNRVLNQPIDTPLSLRKPARDDPFTMSAGDFDKLISNPRRFGWFIDFSVINGLEQAPELAQLQSQLDATKRDIKARRRAFWLPDVSAQAQYADNIDASGLGSGSDFDTANDWNVSVSASWPLTTGGARRSQLARATLQGQQLALQKEATAQRIERSIRAALHAAQSSYRNIELSEKGAEASRKNLELVSDAYSQGAVSIIDLLDAQNQSLQADLSANNAVQDFLLDIMNLQRATSSFDFLLPANLQAERTRALLEYIENRAAEHSAPGVSP